jgi:hypothetical protein
MIRELSSDTLALSNFVTCSRRLVDELLDFAYLDTEPPKVDTEPPKESG